MKYYHFLLFLIVFACSSDNEGEYEVYELFTPIIMSMEDVRTSVAVETPQQIQTTGKIYVKDDLLLVGDEKRGIHIFDNSEPETPTKLAFLAIPGNHDMEMRGDYLFADSYKDLLVFDLSDLTNITINSRQEEVFPYQTEYPDPGDLPQEIQWDSIDDSKNIVVGWERSKELRKKQENFDDIAVDTAESSDTSTGQGGSLARFKIVGQFLYALDDNYLNVFDVSDASNPIQSEEKIYVTWAAETLFLRGDHLFVGSRDGVYIYDVSSPQNPEYISEFTHATMCDPVVVFDDIAYVTLRAGNMCGEGFWGNDQAMGSRLEILDVSNIENPTFVIDYPLENPYGLGAKGDLLFICDGTAGLKVYDKSNINELQLLSTFSQMEAYDVIPLESHLIVIAKEGVFQFNYKDNNEIVLISQFVLN